MGKYATRQCPRADYLRREHFHCRCEPSPGRSFWRIFDPWSGGSAKWGTMISIGLGGSDGSCRSCPGAREGQIRGVHTPRDGPICGSGSRVMRRIMLLVILALVCFLGPGQRIGEAGNPGPGTGLDDSQVSAWVEWTDDETHRDPWSNGPPLDDLSGGAVAGGAMLALPFVAARKFSGHQPGAVFKMGEHGLG